MWYVRFILSALKKKLILKSSFEEKSTILDAIFSLFVWRVEPDNMATISLTPRPLSGFPQVMWSCCCLDVNHAEVNNCTCPSPFNSSFYSSTWRCVDATRFRQAPCTWSYIETPFKYVFVALSSSIYSHCEIITQAFYLY